MARILKSKRELNLLFFISLILITISTLSCSESDNNSYLENNLENYSIPDLIKFGTMYHNDTMFYEICSILNDSVKEKRKNIYLSSIWSLNPGKGTVELDLIYNEDTFANANDNYFFKIMIIDSCIFINEKKETIDHIKGEAETYIFDSHLKKRRKNINYFGEVDLPISGIQITMLMDDKGISNNEWKIFFNSLSEIFSFLEKQRNELSKQKWGVNFESLNFEKKVSVLEIVYYRVLINLNKKKDKANNCHLRN